MMYWTKPKYEFDENSGMNIPTGELEDIKEFEEDWVPDGDGFAVDMGDIKYSTYKKNKSKYEIVEGKLQRKVAEKEEATEEE